MWETIRGYLTFTRKERFGVLFLLLLICALFILPYFIPPAVGDRDPAAYQKMKGDIRKFESGSPDSSMTFNTYTPDLGEKKHGSRSFGHPASSSATADMFYFDPNHLTAGDGARLGLSERLTQTILHYTEKGGRFRRAEDLKKLYGLHDADYNRILPWVRMAALAPKNKPASDAYSAPIIYQPSYKSKSYELTDINLADSDAWSKLPGIGPALSSRIIHFRGRLGGFYEIDQVSETFGLPDSLFQKIKPYLRNQPVSLEQIDLNTAGKETLQAHPYIRWQLAKAILQYRLQHGNFRSVDDLLQLAMMDTEKFKKLKPYLIVKP